ncbi:MAG: GWxTD domain-containing protein [Candidatus Colwellbacteria bacterium]
MSSYVKGAPSHGATVVLLAVLVFAAGCASSGIPKPTVFVDQHNSIPADIPSQFLARYERYIDMGKEGKEFKKLQTDEERQVFIDKFWADRDTDPATPENEEKERIDRLIGDIADERFFSANFGGLLFQSNGGFRGDMAHVYMLYGEPDAMDMVEGQSFVNLMLWIYVDQRNGEILYAFLFYHRGSTGAYSLFSQDAYKLDPCGAVNQIRTLGSFSYVSGECAPDTENILQELYTSTGKAGVLDGYIFTWALFNFSQDGSISQGKALQPPKPASEIARRSRARVVGEAPQRVGTAGTDFILASCKECKSFIPAELRIGSSAFSLRVRRNAVEWQVAGEQAEAQLKFSVIFESKGQKPIVFKKDGTIQERKELIISDPEEQVSVAFLTEEELSKVPAGTYRVTIYVKNRDRHNAWFIEFVKP